MTFPFYACLRPIGVAGVLLVACAEGDSPQSPGGSELEPIALNVRVHLLQSAEFEPLNSGLSDAALATLFEGVNAIWERAGVVWNVESIIREPAQNAEEFLRAFRGEVPPSVQILSSIFPQDSLLRGEWNVIVVKDLGAIAGGFYLNTVGVVIFGEFGPIGAQSVTGAGRRILAHELGHSLGLDHVPCTPEGNLMSPGCASADRTRLTTEQVESARRQAARGSPFGL